MAPALGTVSGPAGVEHTGTCESEARRPRLRVELADVVRAVGSTFRRTRSLRREEERALVDIERCRTLLLGGHMDVCPRCEHRQPSYNSCRNRHCPKCQALSAERWVESRTARLLDTHYFHVVFTLPAELRQVAKQHRERVYEILLKAAGATLVELGADPKRLGAELGVTAVLHTWDRKLGFHPHVHCIVTGGGLARDGQSWVGTRMRYLFPVAVLGALFRGKVLSELERAGLAAGELSDRVRNKSWHVYAKRPFGGPEQVIRYLGRYTHRVGISNARLVSFDGEEVTFRTKNGGTESVGAEEFLARFVEHVLGARFVKIRHYGLLSPSHVQTRLERARCLLGMPRPCAGSHSEASASPARESWVEVFERVAGPEARQCPVCRVATLVRVPLLRPDARAPPN